MITAMTVLKVLGVIAALIALLLVLSVTIVIDAKDNNYTVKARYGFLRFNIYPSKKKPKKPKTKKKAKPKAEKAPSKKKPVKKKKHKLSDYLELAKKVLPRTGKITRKLLSHIRFTDIIADFVIADEDAAETAIKYGKVSAITGNTIAWLSTFFTVSVKRVSISCNFDLKESQYDGHAVIKLRLIWPIVSGFSMIGILISIIREKK